MAVTVPPVSVGLIEDESVIPSPVRVWAGAGDELAWAQRVVELLQARRRAGVRSFRLAWRQALAVSGEWSGRAAPDTETFSEFFSRACEHEWAGKVRVDYMGVVELLAASDDRSR